MRRAGAAAGVLRRAGAGIAARRGTAIAQPEPAAPACILNTATTCDNCAACSCRLCEAAAACSTSAAFCWVASSICAIARFTCSMPLLCSWLAATISLMMSVTRRTLSTISVMVVPAALTSLPPASTFSTESPIRVLISLAAAAERCARLRTSLATTAKPRPCSPARAASTAAFNARMLVWKAMPSMTAMMSTILLEEALIEAMVSTTCATTVPPRTATCDAVIAS